MTQKELAKKWNNDDSFISRIESSNRDIRAVDLRLYHDTFDVSYDYLSGDINLRDYVNEEKALIKKYLPKPTTWEDHCKRCEEYDAYNLRDVLNTVLTSQEFPIILIHLNSLKELNSEIDEIFDRDSFCSGVDLPYCKCDYIRRLMASEIEGLIALFDKRES
jgi:transcriptional regulator with XRE-family HTH domain